MHVPFDALFAIFVGAAAGLGAVGFRYLLYIMDEIFFVAGANLLDFMG
jgi:hypothetical protein